MDSTVACFVSLSHNCRTASGKYNYPNGPFPVYQSVKTPAELHGTPTSNIVPNSNGLEALPSVLVTDKTTASWLRACTPVAAKQATNAPRKRPEVARFPLIMRNSNQTGSLPGSYGTERERWCKRTREEDDTNMWATKDDPLAMVPCAGHELHKSRNQPR